MQGMSLDERSKGQWSFALRQLIDAVEPSELSGDQSEALQLAISTGGASLAASSSFSFRTSPKVASR
ncbi:MAG: hypothetical protein IPK16_30255 [Anaerolineales bacterium]|nr:hypothetical protein [Anaerolineales bacterium]